MPKSRLQRILDKISPNGLTDKSYRNFDIGVNALKEKLKEVITVRTLSEVEQQLTKFRKREYLQPLIDSVEALKVSFDAEKEQISKVIADKLKDLEAVTKEVAQKEEGESQILSGEIEVLKNELSTLEEKIAGLTTIRQEIKDKESLFIGNLTELSKNIKETNIGVLESKSELKALKSLMEEQKIDFRNRLSQIGGGSMNRKISINGTVVSTRYGDINFKGSGVSYAAVDNNTTKEVDLTLTASGGVSSVGATAPITSSGGSTPNISTAMSTNKLIGRGTAGTGVMEEITLGTNLSLSGTTLNATGGGGTPGGSDTQVQFNDSSSFGGDAGLTFNKTSNLLTINNGDFKITAPTAANFFNANITDSVATFEFFQSGIKDHLFTMTNAIFSFNGGGVFSGVVTVAGLTNNAVLISVPVGQSTNNSLAGICELWGATGNPAFVQFNEAGIANRGSFGFAAGSSTLAYRSGATTMSDGTQRWAVDNTGNESLNGKITTYNNIATAGWGTPTVYGSGRSTAQTAAVASVATYTVGAADGSFIITSNVNVTTSTAHSFTVTCTYTDETNTSRTLTLSYIQIGGGTPIATITNVTGAGPYEGVPNHIRCKASTAITIATTGTFTTVTYNVEASIIQIT